MASLTYAQAQSLLAPFITSQGSSDPAVGSSINFVNERFITGGQWRGNRFLYAFQPSSIVTDSTGSYIDTPVGVDSIIKAVAVDSTYSNGEQGDIMSDFYPYEESGLGWITASTSSDLMFIRIGASPAGLTPNTTISDGQRYRIVGKYPETRTIYCIVRRAYVPLVNSTDLLIPSNINAYRYGVQAYNYENINELERAQVYWELAYQCLNQATESYEEGVQNGVEIQTKAFSPSLIRNLI